MNGLARIAAALIGATLIITSPWLWPLAEPYLSNVPGLGVVTEAGTSLWAWVGTWGTR